MGQSPDGVAVGFLVGNDVGAEEYDNQSIKFGLWYISIKNQILFHDYSYHKINYKEVMR